MRPLMLLKTMKLGKEAAIMVIINIDFVIFITIIAVFGC